MKRFALYTAKGDKTGKGGIERDMENEIQQLKRSVNEQVLQRAEADPQWRQQILDDPEAAMSDIPEARQLREILESTTTTMPTTTAGEEHSQLQRSLMEKILDKAARATPHGSSSSSRIRKQLCRKLTSLRLSSF